MSTLRKDNKGIEGGGGVGRTDVDNARGGDKKTWSLTLVCWGTCIGIAGEKKEGRALSGNARRGKWNDGKVDGSLSPVVWKDGRPWLGRRYTVCAGGAHGHAVENWKCEPTEEVSLTAEGVAASARCLPTFKLRFGGKVVTLRPRARLVSFARPSFLRPFLFTLSTSPRSPVAFLVPPTSLPRSFLFCNRYFANSKIRLGRGPVSISVFDLNADLSRNDTNEVSMIFTFERFYSLLTD